MASKWCSQCGLESRSPRYEPIVDGLCKPCRDRNAAQKGLKKTLGQLAKDLCKAVKVEDYETAAKIRDQIRIEERKTREG